MQSCQAWGKRTGVERGLGEKSFLDVWCKFWCYRSVTCLKHSFSVYFCQPVDLGLEWEKLLQILTTKSHTIQIFWCAWTVASNAWRAAAFTPGVRQCYCRGGKETLWSSACKERRYYLLPLWNGHIFGKRVLETVSYSIPLSLRTGSNSRMTE